MKIVVILITFLLVIAASIMFCQPCFAQLLQPEMSWINPMEVNDVAVSKDGKYIVAGNNTGLYYFASSNSIPIWWCEPGVDYPVLSVAISSNGEYVACGTGNVGYILYFINSRSRIGLQSPTWSSQPFADSVARGTFDMSDNGDYIAVGGSGEYVYYFTNCRTRSGSGQTNTWNDLLSGLIYSLDLSSDGQYIAVGGMRIIGGGFVAFYKNAFSSPYPTDPLWWSEDVWAITLDAVVSDDGFAVAAVTVSSSIHYWRGASGLSGNPLAHWNYGVPLTCVDLNSDGDLVVSCSGGFIASLYFWENGRQRNEGTPNWVKLAGEAVMDAAINDDGSIIAAVTMNASGYWAHFYTANGTSIGNAFQLDALSDKISMSSDGSVVAVGGSPFEERCLYVFRITEQEEVIVGGELVAISKVDLVLARLRVLAPHMLVLLCASVTLVLLVNRKKRQ